MHTCWQKYHNWFGINKGNKRIWIFAPKENVKNEGLHFRAKSFNFQIILKKGKNLNFPAKVKCEKWRFEFSRQKSRSKEIVKNSKNFAPKQIYQAYRLNFEIENRDVLFVAKERKVENKRDNSYGSTLIRNNSCDRI